MHERSLTYYVTNIFGWHEPKKVKLRAYPQVRSEDKQTLVIIYMWVEFSEVISVASRALSVSRPWCAGAAYELFNKLIRSAICILTSFKHLHYQAIVSLLPYCFINAMIKVVFKYWFSILKLAFNAIKVRIHVVHVV